MNDLSHLSREAYGHFQEANHFHGQVTKHVGDAVDCALRTGRALLAAKKAVPHGRWTAECERLFHGSARTARFYMEFAKRVSAIPQWQSAAMTLLEGSLKGAAEAAKLVATQSPAALTPPIVGDGEIEPDTSPVSEASPETPPESPVTRPSESRPDTPPPPPKPAREAPEADYGKCPNCLSAEWDEDEFGVSCAKCHHPWGEPAGDPDEDRVKIQRLKTIKTVEATMRAFDDLQYLQARAWHNDAIRQCKALLKMAQEW